MPKRTLCTVLLLFTACLGGCSTVGFYSQAIGGEMSLLVHRRPIAKVLADPHASPALKHKLRVAEAVRKYAKGLGLDVGKSYSTYEDIGRPYVVWNVFAAPEFSLKLKSFCYPVAGCVSYRGFFAKKAASRFAHRLVRQGYDVYMGGVAAYSTLGWFNDPILNTFVNRSDADLAALLFHELAHKTIYVEGDTRFNESYATTVEQVALKRWLSSLGKPAEYAKYRAKRHRQQQVIALIEATNKQLKALYASGLKPVVMRRDKRADIHALRQKYRVLRSSWGNHDDFVWWIETPINNAKLATIATYNDWVPGFKELLAKRHGDMPAFLRAVKRIARLPKRERDAKMTALSGRS